MKYNKSINTSTQWQYFCTGRCPCSGSSEPATYGQSRATLAWMCLNGKKKMIWMWNKIRNNKKCADGALVLFLMFSNSKHPLFHVWKHLETSLNQGVAIEIKVYGVWKKDLLTDRIRVLPSYELQIRCLPKRCLIADLDGMVSCLLHTFRQDSIF